MYFGYVARPKLFHFSFSAVIKVALGERNV